MNHYFDPSFPMKSELAARYQNPDNHSVPVAASRHHYWLGLALLPIVVVVGICKLTVPYLCCLSSTAFGAYLMYLAKQKEVEALQEAVDSAAEKSWQSGYNAGALERTERLRKMGGES